MSLFWYLILVRQLMMTFIGQTLCQSAVCDCNPAFFLHDRRCSHKVIEQKLIKSVSLF